MPGTCWLWRPPDMLGRMVRSALCCVLAALPTAPRMRGRCRTGGWVWLAPHVLPRLPMTCLSVGSARGCRGTRRGYGQGLHRLGRRRGRRLAVRQEAIRRPPRRPARPPPGFVALLGPLHLGALLPGVGLRSARPAGGLQVGMKPGTVLVPTWFGGLGAGAGTWPASPPARYCAGLLHTSRRLVCWVWLGAMGRLSRGCRSLLVRVRTLCCMHAQDRSGHPCTRARVLLPRRSVGSEGSRPCTAPGEERRAVRGALAACGGRNTPPRPTAAVHQAWNVQGLGRVLACTRGAVVQGSYTRPRP